MGDVRLDGRTVLITGANTGIGKETAMDMARRGARLIVCSRNKAKGDEAVSDIKTATGNQNIVLGHVDLASFESIRNFAKHVNESEQRLDILINNAAGPMNFDDLNQDKNYDPWKAYSQSKLANILFTRELHRRLLGTGVTAYSVHPGIVNTNLLKGVDANCCIKGFFCCCKCCFKSPASGAATSIHCAVTVGLENQSGKYFSDSAVKTPKPQAEDDAAALRLWEVSEELIKNTSPGNATALA